MEWIWVVFIVFAIISNLAEKQGKQRKNRPIPPFAQSPPESRPVSPQTDPLEDWVRDLGFFGLEEERTTQEGKDLGRQEERSILRKRDLAERDIVFLKPESASGPVELKRKAEKAVKDLVLEDGIEQDIEDDIIFDTEAFIKREDEALEEFSFSQSVWAGDDGTLQTVLLLAQALPRPDLKTFPWQRKV